MGKKEGRSGGGGWGVMADVSLAVRDRAGGGSRNTSSTMRLRKERYELDHYVFICLCVCVGCAENLFTLLSLYPVQGTCVGAAGVPKKKKNPQKAQKNHKTIDTKSIQVSLFSWRTPPFSIYRVCFAL